MALIIDEIDLALRIQPQAAFTQRRQHGQRTRIAGIAQHPHRLVDLRKLTLTQLGQRGCEVIRRRLGRLRHACRPISASKNMPISILIQARITPPRSGATADTAAPRCPPHFWM